MVSNRQERLVAELYSHAEVVGSVEAFFDRVADETWGKLPRRDGRERWQLWTDSEARRLLSGINRDRLGLDEPPSDAMSAVVEAVYYLGGRRVPWRDTREWLMVVWGWSAEEAEGVIWEALVRNPIPERQRAVGLSTPTEPTIPDLGWCLTIRPSRANVVLV
jgi:hypothetical protein